MDMTRQDVCLFSLPDQNFLRSINENKLTLSVFMICIIQRYVKYREESLYLEIFSYMDIALLQWQNRFGMAGFADMSGSSDYVMRLCVSVVSVIVCCFTIFDFHSLAFCASNRERQSWCPTKCPTFFLKGVF